ncbi:GCN5-related N-acetyltransferase [Kribbella flavida DSM 17836]|uniref:GCN5-related N-acetyltransferase n=1 Tax=Kribbella flavida (strain DSM 17836 / JCM 10339 / NBRC 14399) TaxID=479435 RepID=D2PQ79_KRIFD|nr:GNAT family N-acetyltransferase [Kribbella flavida]ADB34781.1 GCN5-related N-acetyltransferase [Kribbella flavida DSM 17836]
MELRGFDGDQAVVAGWATSAQEVALLSGRNEFPFPVELRQNWRNEADDVEAYLYYVNGAAVGYAELWLDDEEDEVEVARVIVRPEARGRGIGTAFVRALLGPALDAGYADVFLRVRPDNVPALRTYRRVGFELVPAELADEWNKDQPLPYTWMQYPKPG